MTRILQRLIRLYQLLFSSFFGRSCRFYPTCSSYASQSLHRFGWWRGSLLAAYRLLRCQPLHPGGVDPVPDTFPRLRFTCKRPCAKDHQPPV